MDPAGLLSEIQEATTLRQAFDYAIFERINRSHFFDHFEIATAYSNRDVLLSQIAREFADVDEMVPGRAYAYFPPKGELCFRRMINLPFKDLVIRNAVCIVLAKYLDPELCSECFANRRARGEDAATSLTADYAKRSWPNFCDWQFENANKSQVLLVTDVSTFYDSVSHSYLMETLSSLLGIPEECSVMSLVKRFCQPSVEAYMELTQTIGEPKVVQQGLLTGNETEGILANLFLKPVDDDMLQLDVVYGRYNDDIRIFGDNLREVERAGLVLQQALLSRGLNLNAKKTRMAEGPEKMKALISRTIRQHRYGYEYEYGFGEVAYPNWSDPESVAESDTDDLLKKIDRRFEDFDREFQQDEKLCKHKDALEFCKFLAMADGVYDQRKALSIREEWHVDRLVEIIERFHGRSRFAAWRLIETAVFPGVRETVKNYAAAQITRLLTKETTPAYGRYRLLHHMVKPRRVRDGRMRRYVDDWPKGDREMLVAALQECLKIPAIELVLISLYAMWVLVKDSKRVAEIGRKMIGPKMPAAVSEALSQLREGTVSDIPVSKIWETPWNEQAPY